MYAIVFLCISVGWIEYQKIVHIQEVICILYAPVWTVFPRTDREERKRYCCLDSAESDVKYETADPATDLKVTYF